MFLSLPVFHHEPAGRAEVERRLVNITVGREVSYTPEGSLGKKINKTTRTSYNRTEAVHSGFSFDSLTD